MNTAFALSLFAGVLLCSAPSGAGPCTQLNAEQKKIARDVMDATYPYDCCDEKLTACLKQKKVCKLALRLGDDICRRVSRGQEPAAIKGALTRRARSMSTVGKSAKISLSGLSSAGAAKAPVTVVVYACSRCPFCSKVVPRLHKQIVKGGLKGKARLYLKAFPIRSHKGSAAGGLALVSAQKLGKFWPFTLKLYGEFDSFDRSKLAPWAGAVGLDQAAFQKEMKDKGNRAALVEAKKEGLRNGVNATPTLFINGRKYHGDLAPETLLDVISEEADRLGGRMFSKPAPKGIFK